MSRPTIFTPELGATICERLAEYGSLRRVCRDDVTMPTDNRVRQWVAEDEEFGKAYARAKEAGIHALVEEGIAIVDEPPPVTNLGGTDSGHVAWAKSRAEYRRWLAERMMPRVYGVKAGLELTGADGGPVRQSIIIATGVPRTEQALDDLV